MVATPAPDIAFIIPVRDDAARLDRCLQSIRRSGLRVPLEIIVSDNGSLDNSRQVAIEAGGSVLELPGVRVSELRNRAAARAEAALLAFVDADHTLAEGWLAAALDVFADAGVVAAGAPYSSPPNANWVQRAYDRLRSRRSGRHDTDWLGSGNLVVRRAAFETVGGFDNQLETCEDVDLCNRLRLSGFRLVTDEGLGSVHHGDPGTWRAVFLGELWRGRDNFRVTLRGPLTARSLVSLALPVINLALLVIGVGGLLAIPMMGVAVPLIALGASAALVALRAVRMSLADAGSTAGSFPANLAVAAAYELGRAFALVARATHRTRREIAGERAHA